MKWKLSLIIKFQNQLPPIRIVFFNQINLPLTVPFLQPLLPRNSFGDRVEPFIPDKASVVILSREARFVKFGFMFVEASSVRHHKACPCDPSSNISTHIKGQIGQNKSVKTTFTFKESAKSGDGLQERGLAMTGGECGFLNVRTFQTPAYAHSPLPVIT